MKNETQQPLMKTHIQSISVCVSGVWALPGFFFLFFLPFEQWFMCLCPCVWAWGSVRQKGRAKGNVFSTAVPVSVNELSNSSKGITWTCLCWMDVHTLLVLWESLQKYQKLQLVPLPKFENICNCIVNLFTPKKLTKIHCPFQWPMKN